MLCIFKISGAVLQKTAVNFILKTGVAVIWPWLRQAGKASIALKKKRTPPVIG